jgi:hypothetical protein
MAASGCATMSKFKVDANGTYRFKDAPFTVKISKECMPDYSVQEKPQYVVFSTGAGYWQFTGQYDLRIMTLPDTIRDEASFVNRTKKFLPDYLTQDNAHSGSSGLTFEVQETKQVEIGGKAAFQGVAVAKGKAEFVATAVYHGNWITVAGLVYPLDLNRHFPWKCYDDFVSSVSQTK